MEKNPDENFEYEKEMFAKRIAGEIVFSDEPGQTLKKWREIFKISQRKLADKVGIIATVISDYENGRRKSPGIRIIHKIVNALIEIDNENGGKIIREFATIPVKNTYTSAIIDLKEFSKPVSIKDLCNGLDAIIVVGEQNIDKRIYGYTVVDGMKAIMDFPSMELVKLYGLTSLRALIFIGAHKGRSTMVALKVTNLKPGIVILQSNEGIDELAKRIANSENIPVAIVRKSTSDILDILKKTFK